MAAAGKLKIKPSSVSTFCCLNFIPSGVFLMSMYCGCDGGGFISGAVPPVETYVVSCATGSPQFLQNFKVSVMGEAHRGQNIKQ
jgi:hypothetical protein